jgi:hypothetical protein
MQVYVEWRAVCPPEQRKEAERRGQGLRCIVEVATGDYGRVVNKQYGIERWRPPHRLYVREDDPHAPPPY